MMCQGHGQRHGQGHGLLLFLRLLLLLLLFLRTGGVAGRPKDFVVVVTATVVPTRYGCLKRCGSGRGADDTAFWILWIERP